MMNDFIKSIMDKLINLIHDRIAVNNITYTIKSNAIVCDTPACSIIKVIIYHTGYYSCERKANILIIV